LACLTSFASAFLQKRGLGLKKGHSRHENLVRCISSGVTRVAHLGVDPLAPSKVTGSAPCRFLARRTGEAWARRAATLLVIKRSPSEAGVRIQLLASHQWAFESLACSYSVIRLIISKTNCWSSVVMDHTSTSNDNVANPPPRRAIVRELPRCGGC